MYLEQPILKAWNDTFWLPRIYEMSEKSVCAAPNGIESDLVFQGEPIFIFNLRGQGTIGH